MTRRFVIGIVSAVIFIAGMTLAADLIGCHEIFFPEILALAMGCFVMPRRPWNVTPVRLFLTMTVGAWLGWGLLQAEVVPTSVLMLFGFFLCGLWLFSAGTNMVPMLSACLLPLMLRRASIVYPISISTLTFLLLFLEHVLVKSGLRDQQPYERPAFDWRRVLIRWSLLTLLLSFLLVPAINLGGFWGVPPLVVGFTAFADQKRPLRRRFFQGITVFIVAALLGAGGAWLSSQLPVVPRCIVTGCLTGIFLLFCRSISYFMPPSGAVLMLPFLLPPESLYLYAFQVPIGAICFLTAGRFFSWGEEHYFSR